MPPMFNDPVSIKKIPFLIGYSKDNLFSLVYLIRTIFFEFFFQLS